MVSGEVLYQNLLLDTFPTPVGPKSMKDATGRFELDSPARDIRTTLLAATAWSWPTTRSWSVSSI